MLGKLIVFEGIEGSGKTTQIQSLQEWLRAGEGLEILSQEAMIPQVVVTREPGGTAIGQHLRQLLLTGMGTEEAIQDRTELLLYAADRAQHVEGFLKPLLQQGTWILCDRYIDSTVAYQGYGRGLDLDLIHQLNGIATGGLQSDLTLWLDLEVEQGLTRTRQRGDLDRIEQADLSFHQRVRQGYRALAQASPDRRVAIDASPGPSIVAQQIQATLKEYLRQW
ncbi:MAG: dTMP kinase [Leptolyngbyaceae cyanobacterium bins.59]|nr:dTMP kinase [Leptolyngbyaceae cyanobacterium bins.59]